MLRETSNGHFHASMADHVLGGDVPCCRLELNRLGRFRFGCSDASIAESLQETPLAQQCERSGVGGRIGSGTSVY
jgi:hypothetical protein